MAEKAQQIVSDALQEILVKAAEIPLTADEMATGIRYFNRMMAALDARGISLGFTIITSPSQEVTIPLGAVQGAVKNLAVVLAPQFNKPVSASLLEEARAGLNDMRKLSAGIGAMEFPSTLPIGSGNEGDTFRTDRFYADLQDTILAESNGSLGLEDATT